MGGREGCVGKGIHCGGGWMVDELEGGNRAALVRRVYTIQERILYRACRIPQNPMIRYVPCVLIPSNAFVPSFIPEVKTPRLCYPHRLTSRHPIPQPDPTYQLSTPSKALLLLGHSSLEIHCPSYRLWAQARHPFLSTAFLVQHVRPPRSRYGAWYRSSLYKVRPQQQCAFPSLGC